MTEKNIAVFADDCAAYEELCNGARNLGGCPVALFVGSDEDAQRVAAFGARVLQFGELPGGARFEDCADAFESALRELDPVLVLARMSKRTQCVAGRLAVRLHAPVVTDVTQILLSDEGAELSHLVYGGSAKRVERSRGMAIALVGAGVFEVDGAQDAGSVEHRHAVIVAGAVKLISVQEKQEESVDLSVAKCVVCVGRGIQSEENVAQAQQFASHVSGEMACTRPVAEGEGWMARSRYLGVSGASVKPEIYIGMGVSGQVQHTVGMTDSQFVVAVNKDKNAPLMKHCDLGLVADIEAVLPVLAAL